MTTELNELRAQLDVLDRRLLETAAARQRLVREIQRAKAAGGTALFDRDREKIVFEKAERTARDVGLAPELGRAIMQQLVEASHNLQADIGVVAGAERKRILFVGAAGGMATLLSSAFAARGHEVDGLERDDGRDRAAAVAAADITIIAVPMDSAVRVAAELAPHVRPDALLCDINSLKLDVCRVMAEGCRGEVLGTHPMFGPSVHSLRRQKFVICPVRTGPLAEWLCAELGRFGLELIESEPEHHDRMMAVVQVLVHFRTLVMGEALRLTGVPVEESLRFTSPIYRLELAVVGRLFAQDPMLYAEIEMSNPHGAEVRAAFLQAAETVAGLAAGGDREAFCAQFGRVASYFAGFSDEAMSLSDFLIDRIVERP
jgi:chorismate mutase/prephenate dehydrogenase